MDKRFLRKKEQISGISNVAKEVREKGIIPEWPEHPEVLFKRQLEEFLPEVLSKLVREGRVHYLIKPTWKEELRRHF